MVCGWINVLRDELAKDPILGKAPTIDGFKLLDPVLVTARIGGGGMGSVYRGRHLNLDIEVAVKCLDQGLAARDRDFVARFKREARVAASINHQNLIHVYDVAENHGIHYLVMELVSGESIAHRVKRRGPLPEAEALGIFRNAAKGLAAAHKLGIVHRDVKPDNILIASDGEVKVADLGLAKACDSARDGMTATNVTLGTPNYMPPEQWEDAMRVGPSTDVYALAATLFFMLTGKDAWRGANLVEVMRKITTETFPDIREHVRDISAATADLLRCCTAHEATARPVDCGAVVALVDAAFELPEVPSGEVGYDELSERPTNFLPSEATLEKARTSLGKNASLPPTVVQRPKASAPVPPKSFVSKRAPRRREHIAIGAAVLAVTALAGVLMESMVDERGPSPSTPVVTASAPNVERAENVVRAEVEDEDEVEPTETAASAPAESAEATSQPVAEKTSTAEPLAAKPDPAPDAPKTPEVPTEFLSPRDGAVYRLVQGTDGRRFYIAETETTVGSLKAFLASLPAKDLEPHPEPSELRPPPDDDGPPPRPFDPRRHGPPPDGRGRPPRHDGPPPEADGEQPTRRPIRDLAAKRRQAEGPIAAELKQLLDRTAANEPAINVPIATIRAYSLWVAAGLRDGGRPGSVRLPTVAEWQAAAGRAQASEARYPATSTYPDGDGLPGRDLKGGANWNGRAMRPVKSFEAGAHGLFDMPGNAAEICDDGPSRGLFLIGGSFWSTKAEELELDALRAYRPPEPFSSAAGFRLVYVE